MGNWDTLSSLATLAFSIEYVPRAQYFRRELVNAMRLVDNKTIPMSSLKGNFPYFKEL